MKDVMIYMKKIDVLQFSEVSGVLRNGKQMPILLNSMPNKSQFEPPHDKTNNVAVRPAKTQISLSIRPV